MRPSWRPERKQLCGAYFDEQLCGRTCILPSLPVDHRANYAGTSPPGVCVALCSLNIARVRSRSLEWSSIGGG